MPIEISLTSHEVLESLKDQRGTILASYGADRPDEVPAGEYRDYISDIGVLVDLEALDHAIELYRAIQIMPFGNFINELVSERSRYLNKHGEPYRINDGRPFSFDINTRLTQADVALSNKNPRQAQWNLVKAAERTIAAWEAIAERFPTHETD